MQDVPFAICRTHDLAEAGAFATADVAGTPVLVARDARGTVRAFVNLCRHRGVRLVHEKRGTTRSFTCLLHGWTYDAEGQMGGAVVARLATTNPTLQAIRDHGALTLLPSAIRHGFVWTTPNPRAAIDVASFLGPLDATLGARGLSEFRVRARGESATDGDLAAQIRPRLSVDDALHVLSDELALVLHPRDVSVFLRLDRRVEHVELEPPPEPEMVEEPRRA